MTKILLVDDEERMRNLLTETLEKRGFSVVPASSGEAALTKLKEEKFDLVLTDIKPPVMNGVELLKLIKSIKKDLPVLFITAADMDQTLHEALQFGLDGYLEKPFNLNTLFETIEAKTAKP